MIVRDGTEEDFSTCIGFGYKFFQFTKYKDIPYDGESVRRMLEGLTENGLFIVATHNGEVIAMAGAIIAPAYFNNAYLVGAEVFWWVEPEYRDSGVGGLLLTTLERKAKNEGVHFWSMMILEGVEVEKSIAIYKKLGYEPAERTFMKIL